MFLCNLILSSILVSFLNVYTALANCERELISIQSEGYMDAIEEIKILGSERSEYTFILIPGGPGLGPEYMFQFANLLSKDHQVVLMRSGFSCCNGNINLNSLTRELMEVVNQFSRNSEVILIAHSGGAPIALNYLKLSKSPTKTILISWIYDMNWLSLYYKYNKDAPKRIDYLNKINNSAKSPIDFLRNRMLAFISDYFQNPDEVKAEEILNLNNYYPDVATPLEAELKSGPNFIQSLSNLSTPILSIIGKNDRVIFPEYYNLIPEEVRIKLNMVVIDDSGHFPFIEQPNQVIENINNFISSFKHKEDK